MKKKEFKEYLKNEIIEILSEEESAEDIKAKAAAQAELNKELEKTQSLTKESLNPEVTKAVDRFIKSMAQRYNYSEQDAVFAIQAALKQREFDKPADIPGFEGTMDTLNSLSIREEEEPTSADIKKEKSIVKEKEDALKTKEEIDKIKKDLKKNKSEMLKISKIDRKDRTKAEQSLFNKMVDKTKELKKLERNL